MRLLLAAIGAAGAVALRAQPPPFESFASLVARPVVLKPELRGVHPRVFVTNEELAQLRIRARTTHKEEWAKVLAALPALKKEPPPAPGPQERRSQNDVAYAIAGASLAYAVEQKPEYLAAAKTWTFAAIDYEPWGYAYNKPNVDLAAGHLLYAVGWAYDLLYADLTDGERARIRTSLERHAELVYAYFAPQKNKVLNFTQNHDFIPTSGLAVAALALAGESREAEKWAALARAHHDRANRLLSADGYYYEGMEYWIFSIPWLVHFYDAWEHTTGESLWLIGPARNWKAYLAHALLPDGQTVFDFGDIWEGALTRAKSGAEYGRVYPGGTLQSNFNVMYRVAARLQDPESQAVAERYAKFRHSNLEEYWTLIWRDPSQAAAPMERLPLSHHFKDMGVVYWRTSWNGEATAVAFKAGPPEGHRATQIAASGAVPEWSLDSGHSHPDNGSFIIWAKGTYLSGDSGYAGLPQAMHHNTITVGGVGQGIEGQHDVWRKMPAARLDRIRIIEATPSANGIRIQADVAGAYPESAGLSTFLRTFIAEAARFVVEDTVATASAKTIEWYVHSDAPISQSAGTFVLGNALRLTIDPPSYATRVGPTTLMAPGQPGSITKGEEERRGFHVRIQSPPATSAKLRVVLQ